MEKKKIIYKGIYPIRALFSGFSGPVNPGDVIEVMEPSYSELITHDDWQAVQEERVTKRQKINGGDE